MRIGMVGLGRMGAGITGRLVSGGHEVIAYDLNEDAVKEAISAGAIGVTTLTALVGHLPAPRAVWVMVPSGDGDLASVAPWVADSGEGRWTVAEAIALEVPAPVMTLALIQRLRSRDDNSFGDRLLAALRQQFGGHATRRESDGEPDARG